MARVGKTKRKTMRRRKTKGGSLSAAVSTAVVPFGLLALQKYQHKKSKKGIKTMKKSKKFRR
jgi:hypothetical protein